MVEQRRSDWLKERPASWSTSVTVGPLQQRITRSYLFGVEVPPCGRSARIAGYEDVKVGDNHE